ncbi:MAG: tetratricopeptide repeat protein [Fimbriimonadaceae bacterium]|nr:tetratricopeptide repeat protein [Chitinophagales bacterium]
MQLKGKAAIISAILLLSIAVGIFFFRDEVVSLINKKTNSEGSLSMIEKLTPEIEELSKQIRLDPNNAQLIFNRADQYFVNNNLKYALLDYKKAYHIDSTNQTFVIGLADCYFEVNYPDSSILVLETFLKHDPNNIDVLMDAAIDYFLLPSPKHTIALDKLNSILKIDIQNSEAYFYRGLILKETGDTLAAIRSFQTAVETNPDYYDAYMQLGLLYADRKDPVAVKYFENAIALNDTSNEAAYAKAKFMQDHGNLGDAIEYYKNIITRNPQDADALYNLATIYYGIDSIEKAYRMFDLAIKQDPAKPEAYFGKGLCAEELNKPDEAISFYKQALNLNPNYTDAEEQLNKLKQEQQ